MLAWLVVYTSQGIDAMAFRGQAAINYLYWLVVTYLLMDQCFTVSPAFSVAVHRQQKWQKTKRAGETLNHSSWSHYVPKGIQQHKRVSLAHSLHQRWLCASVISESSEVHIGSSMYQDLADLRGTAYYSPVQWTATYRYKENIQEIRESLGIVIMHMYNVVEHCRLNTVTTWV